MDLTTVELRLAESRADSAESRAELAEAEIARERSFREELEARVRELEGKRTP